MLCDLVNSDEFGALKGTKLIAICPFSLILALFTSSKLVEEEALVCISMYPQYLDLDGYKSIWICRVQKIGHTILPECEQCVPRAFRQCALSRFKCIIDISASEGPETCFWAQIVRERLILCYFGTYTCI